MIKFNQVTKKFKNGTTAIDYVSFDIEPGELVFVTGPSGAGKTTLGRLLLREFPPTQGEIQVGEYELANLKRKELPDLRQQIGFIFQDFKLLTDRTAAENIALSLEILGKSNEEISARIDELLELTQLVGKENLYPSQLSGGETQRTVIARAIAHEPAVLFADEPTGNLDINTAGQITKLLKDINNLGTTVIMSTHNQDMVEATKQRNIKLDKGKIVKDTKKKSHEAKAKHARPTPPKEKHKNKQESAHDE